MFFKLGLISCFIVVCVAMENEPQCYSRFDYEYKVVQKLVELEQKQKQCDAEIQALQSLGKAREGMILYLENAHKEQVVINKELAGKNKELEKSIETARNETTTLISELEGMPKALESRENKGYQSSFSVYGSAKTGLSGTIKFSTVITNHGGHYDAPTGRFTCVYSGTYFFTLNLYKKSSVRQAYCYIRKNGSTTVLANSFRDNTKSATYSEASASVILHLVRGDVVDLGSGSTANTMDSENSFAGFLIMAD